jgi:hypothetical protein
VSRVALWRWKSGMRTVCRGSPITPTEAGVMSREPVSGRQGERWRWYRSRFTRPAVAVAVAVAAFALSAVTNRLLGSDADSGNDATDNPSLLVRAVVVPVFVGLLFSPYLLWQLLNTRRARYTGHVHVNGGPLPPPGIIDVCDAASVLRRQGHRYLAARFGACVFVGIAAGVLPTGAALVAIFVVALLILPVVWSLSAHHARRHHRKVRVLANPAIAPTPPSATRSLVLWAEVAVLQVAGVVLIVLGWVSLVTLVSFSAFLPIAAVHLPLNEILLAFPAIVALVIVYLTACSLVARTGRRLRITAAALANQARARPFVLYLRSWVDDRGMVASGGTEWWRLAEFFSFRARIAVDEVIARELGKTSSVISLAEPAAPRFYVPLGAVRRRVSGDQWRQYVLDRMDEAALIVISIGTSEALLWELGMATKHGHLARLIMVMPPAIAEDAQLRWKASADAIAEAGGPLLGAVADPSSVVLARISDTGIRQVLVVDQLNESAYSAAFSRLLAADPIPSCRPGRRSRRSMS